MSFINKREHQNRTIIHFEGDDYCLFMSKQLTVEQWIKFFKIYEYLRHVFTHTFEGTQEIKTTNCIKENLLADKVISNEYKPMEIFSTDYCVLKNSNYGHIHILAAINPITQFVSYVSVNETQS